MSISKLKRNNVTAVKTKRNQGELASLRPKVSARSRIRPIGNSKGIILSNQLIRAAGLNTEADVVIQAADGIIYILQLKVSDVNTDLSTWDKQFKSAIKKGAKPEGDFFEGMANDFDSKEW
jgi:antitoxin component of MazEF toxin-antitoxin module